MSKVAVIALIAASNPTTIDQPTVFKQYDKDFYAKDLVVELIVQCPRQLLADVQYSVISYSRIEKLYCSPDANCFNSASSAINQACSP